MIISAPEVGPMIAGFNLSNGNTHTSGSRCAATDFSLGNARRNTTPIRDRTRIKRRAAIGVGSTADRANPTCFSHLPKGREGQAVSKPRCSFYVTRAERAVTDQGQPVVKSTVTFRTEGTR